MSCPTCDHTMQSLGIEESLRHYWCPRCGTLRTVNSGGQSTAQPWTSNHDEAPMLVERCRELEQVSVAGPGSYEDWYAVNAKRLGISEAIHKPEDRPQ